MTLPTHSKQPKASKRLPPELGSGHPEAGALREKGVRYHIEPLKQTLNSCGTTALAMVLNAFHHPVTQQALDKRYRKNAHSFTAVQTLVEAARHHGLYAEAYNEASFEDIQQHLLDRHLIIVSALDVNIHKYGLDAHYQVLHGFGYNNHGEPLVAITDPGNGRSLWQTFESLRADWGAPRFLNMTVGYSHLMIVVSQSPDLAPRRMSPLADATDQFSYAINALLNAGADLRHGHLWQALHQTSRALTLGIPAFSRIIFYKVYDKPRHKSTCPAG